MKLLIKQKLLSIRDRFTIYDEQQEPRFYVEGELFTIGKKLHIYDMKQHEVAMIQRRVLSFRPRFFVMVEGKEVAEIVREITFFKPKYRIEGLDWTITGDVFQHDYKISNRDEVIARISKEWFVLSDTYEIDVEDEDTTIYALAVVLAIDCVQAELDHNVNVD